MKEEALLVLYGGSALRSIVDILQACHSVRQTRQVNMYFNPEQSLLQAQLNNNTHEYPDFTLKQLFVVRLVFSCEIRLWYLLMVSIAHSANIPGLANYTTSFMCFDGVCPLLRSLRGQPHF